MAMYVVVVDENGEESGRLPLNPKTFSTGRVGYFANGRIEIDGISHSSTLTFTKPDATLRRAGESDSDYAARQAEIKEKAQARENKSKSKHGPVTTVKPGNKK